MHLSRTGVGKSQLAIELALSVSGKLESGQREDASRAVSGRPTSAEIINADSMQVYRGLDIITNKATLEERQQVPHHLMDFLDPGEEYRVDHFRKDAMQKVRCSGNAYRDIVIDRFLIN
jgi:tRNA dimethylallyltransferase